MRQKLGLIDSDPKVKRKKNWCVQYVTVGGQTVIDNRKEKWNEMKGCWLDLRFAQRQKERSFRVGSLILVELLFL